MQIRKAIEKRLEKIYIAAFVSALIVAAFLFFKSYQLLPAEILSLPYFAFLSTLRIAVAYIISLIFAIAMGFAAATRKWAERILLPTLDILQSVPVVGFFPVAIYFFVAIFRGERLGIELASIFLIFTSQAWNMAFGVYESLITIPKDYLRLRDAYNISGSLAFRKLYLPATIPSLVYNSMVSWANSWFFMMSNEIFAIGARRYELPGLGYFLWKSSEEGNLILTVMGLFTLIVIVLGLEFFLWRPLSAWSRKYSYQMVPYGETEQSSVILSKMIDFLLLIRFSKWKEAVYPRVEKIIDSIYRLATMPDKLVIVLRKTIKFVIYVFLLSSSIYLLYRGVVFTIWIMEQPWPHDSKLIPFALPASISRLAITYLMCLIFTMFVVYIVCFHKAAGDFILAVSKILASIPGTATKPLLMALLLESSLPFSLELISIFVLFSTMIWYLMFPVAGQVLRIPREIRESVESFTQSRIFILKKVILPGAFPAFVTGSLAAWGAGWNALVVAEYSVFKRKTYSTFGIGALIDKAAYDKGDPVLLALCLIALVVTIIIINRLVWQPLYRLAARKYRLEVE